MPLDCAFRDQLTVYPVALHLIFARMASAKFTPVAGTGCACCASCSCRRRAGLDTDSEDSDVELVLSPIVSQGNYNSEVWSISGYISSLNSSDVDISDNMLSGIGLLVGKAIFAFGKTELRAVQWLWARYRRVIIQRALSREIRHLKRGTDRMFDDLVAFQQ